MKKEEQEIEIFWWNPKLEKNFLDFLQENVTMIDGIGGVAFFLKDIEKTVKEEDFVLPAENANFFELGKEMGITIVSFNFS